MCLGNNTCEPMMLKTPTGQSNFDQPWQDLGILQVTKSLWTQANLCQALSVPTHIGRCTM